MNELNGEELPIGNLKNNFEESHEVVYADQAMALGYGPFVSRITFGVENHLAQSRSPVVTIVMPTNMLHALARNVIAELDSKEAKESISKAHRDYAGSNTTE